MTPQNKTRIKIWSVLVCVFILGCVTGAALNGLYRSRADARDQPRGPDEFFNSLRRDLKLSDDQATAIRAILDETRDEFRALRTEVRPRYDALRQKANARIRERLTPEQQQKFDALVAKRDAQRNEQERRR
jgi:Spy/CpxP family protein refolding chaperone